MRPAGLTVTSGLNAIARAAEGLYARDANPVMSLMAEEGIRALASGIPAVFLEPADLDARAGTLTSKKQEQSMKIGFIGTGKIGLPMARHLAAAGNEVLIFDVAPAQVAAARQAGLSAAPSLAEAVAEAEVVFSSMPNDAAFTAVSGQVAADARPGTLYIDTSTISPHTSAAAVPALATRDIGYLRVTVSGNNHMAEAARLTALVSGPAAAYERVKPLLAALGPAQFYLGEAEEARLMKLVVNLLIGLTSGMLAEALTLGRKGGLDWAAMWDVITASAVASPIVKAKSAQLAVHDYTPTFTVDQMLKDVGLILDAGAQLRVPMGLTALLGQMLQGAAAQGMAGDDYAAVIKSAGLAAGLQPG